MIGIGSFLTDEAYLAVRDLQLRLRDMLQMPEDDPIPPHVTYVLAADVDRTADSDPVVDKLALLAAQTDPFTVQTSDLGLFLGPSPVIYLPIPRSPMLSAVHQALCQLFSSAAVPLYYRPENWLPHVTLVQGASAGRLVDAAVTLFPSRSIQLESRLNGLSLLENVETAEPEVTYEFPFRGLNQLEENPFGLTSRPCQPSDRDFVYRLVEETLKPCVSAYCRWDEQRFDQGFAASWHQRTIILAEGRPVGIISFTDEPSGHLYVSGLLLKLAVHGRGWGHWLLDHLERQAGGRPVRLHVWENNPAVGFYRRHRYHILATEDHKHLMEKRPA